MEIIRSPKTSEEWTAYYALRYKVLREPLGQPVGSEKNDGDILAKHFALFHQEKIIAIARLDNVDAQTSQARFVGVHFDYHGNGFGKKIMTALEDQSLLENKPHMLLHARENALPFYKSMGYKIEEKSYLLYDQIQHYKMSKIL